MKRIVTDSYSYDSDYSSTKNETYHDEVYGSISSSKTFDFALKYLQNGLSIFPIPKPDSKSDNDGKVYDGKRPHIAWTEYQSRIARYDEIEAWFSGNDDNNNIAIITGKVSNIFVIDIDGERSKLIFQSYVLNRLSSNLKDAIENTMHVRPGGGEHFYIRLNLKIFLME